MTHQLTFDEIRRARTDDPATSKDAARQSHSLAGEHRRQILAALDGGAELTAGEIAERCGLTSLQVSRRMAELRGDGEIEATGDTKPTLTGRRAQCWRRPRPEPAKGPLWMIERDADGMPVRMWGCP